MPKFTKKLLGSAFVNKFVAEIQGKRSHEREYLWMGGERPYTHITGGIILPQFEASGYIVTVGVGKNNRFHCLEEFESRDELDLISRAKSLQAEYGPGVIRTWWGDAEHLMSLVNDGDNPVIISFPIDYDKSDSFQIYRARLGVSLLNNAKQFYFHDCDKLKSQVVAFNRDKTASEKNNPAVAMLGWVVHTLLMYRPWEQAVERIELIPTTMEEHMIYADQQAERDLYSEVYGEAV